MAQLTLPGVEGDAQSPESLTIAGDEIQAVSPEGEACSMKITDWIERIAPARMDTCGMVLPDGVKCVIPVPKGLILVHQTPPRVHSFKWIAADSPAHHGPGTTYREVRIALPYLVLLAVFEESRGPAPKLGNSSEAFFSNRPLDAAGLATELCYPALLNCSRFPDEAPNRPLSWVCVQHLSDSARTVEGPQVTADASLRKGLSALLRHLLESGFNRSSEHHEVSSWYSETVDAEIDPRLATVEAWQEASAEDPLFALQIPWLPTGHTLGGVAERIAGNRRRRRKSLSTARDIARTVFQGRPGGA